MNKHMNKQSLDKKLKEILDRLANGERNWIHDQLDGTSMVQENLDAVDESVREAQADILKWAAEEVIGQDKHNEYKKLDTNDEFIFGDQIIYDIENNLKAEQRKRLQLDNSESE